MTSHYYTETATPDATKRYPSDLNDREFDLVAPHGAQKDGSGKKRTVDIREVLMPSSTAPEPVVAATAERAQNYRAKAKAANTVAAYHSDWNDFTSWCRARRVESLPAESATVVL
jgi:hypothetical protein